MECFLAGASVAEVAGKDTAADSETVAVAVAVGEQAAAFLEFVPENFGKHWKAPQAQLDLKHYSVKHQISSACSNLDQEYSK